MLILRRHNEMAKNHFQNEDQIGLENLIEIEIDLKTIIKDDEISIK